MALPSPPYLEVTARPRRRSFTAAYKAALLAELDACQHPGEIGAILRRELEAARLAIDIQKKVSALMTVGLTGNDDEP